eukprot:6179058-Pleurochrysis_carterae.AAC.1
MAAMARLTNEPASSASSCISSCCALEGPGLIRGSAPAPAPRKPRACGTVGDVGVRGPLRGPCSASSKPSQAPRPPAPTLAPPPLSPRCSRSARDGVFALPMKPLLDRLRSPESPDVSRLDCCNGRNGLEGRDGGADAALSLASTSLVELRCNE